MSKEEEKNSKSSSSMGLFTAVGFILGIGGAEVFDFSLDIFDRWAENNKITIDRQHSNIERVIEIWDKDGDTQQKAVFTGVLVQSEMVPKDTACSLIAYALTSPNQNEVYRSLISVFPENVRDELFVKAECDLDNYISPPDLDSDRDPSPSPTGRLECPTGILFTQFGERQQIDFGRELQAVSPMRSDSRFEITAPEHIDGFDAENITIRYFIREKKRQARQWHDYLEAILPEVDVKYAYLSGFEGNLFDEDQFELWWPSSKPVPDGLNEIKCF